MSGCQKTTPVPPATSGITKTFKIRGKVTRNRYLRLGTITLDHEAIPGFMDAMIMPYKLADPSIMSELHPGDKITLRTCWSIRSIPIRQVATRMRGLTNIVVVAQAKPDYKPAVQFHVPAAGDPVPNFALLNQSGKTIHLDQFKGKRGVDDVHLHALHAGGFSARA